MVEFVPILIVVIENDNQYIHDIKAYENKVVHNA